MIDRALRSSHFWLLIFMVMLFIWTALTIWRNAHLAAEMPNRHKFPRVGWGGSTLCGLGDDDYEGGYIVLEWLGLCLELSFGRSDR